MIEKVARAIAAAAVDAPLIDSVDFVQTGQRERTPDGEIGDILYPKFYINAEAAMDLARAAIEAMREPTEAMDKVGWDISAEARTAKKAWHAMIDAALTTTE